MKITTTGTQEVQRKFRKLIKKVKDKKTLFNRIGLQLLNEIATTFKTETHEGKRWAPVGEKTLGRRRGHGGGKILQDTGTLRRSFEHKATNSNVKIGTQVVYAPTHEFGRGNIPARPMLPTKKRGLDIAVETADKYIKDSIRKTGLK